MSERR